MMGVGIGLPNAAARRRGATPGPKVTVAPAITGTPKVGEVLTVSSGTWTGTGSISYAYQWLRDGAAISGATAATYTLVAADDLTAVSCRVTATDDNGSRTATAAAESVTYAAPVAAGALADQTYSQAEEAWTVDASTDFTGDGIVYSLTTAPAGTSINASTGVITGTKASALSATSVVVRGTNSGGYDESGFSVTVSEQSEPLTIAALTDVGSGTWTVPAGVTTLTEVLIVAGGGGGGGRAYGSGGGGAGGVVHLTNVSVTPGQVLPFTVGAGGSGSIADPFTSAGKGEDSEFLSQVAVGGGKGGLSGTSEEFAAGGDGGSGGGGGPRTTTGVVSGGSGAPAQGFDGGSAYSSSVVSYRVGGGGGGAGAVGVSRSSAVQNGGSGGAGLYFDTFGEYGVNGWFGGGGGGGKSSSSTSYTNGEGGNGGGGGAGPSSTGLGAGRPGSENTGGGGGGCASGGDYYSGGGGGSGVILIAY